MSFDTSRIGLLTPYTRDINRTVADRYAAEGVSVVDERHLGLSLNEAFARVDPEQLVTPSLELAAGVDGRRPDALAHLCTNLYGAPIVAAVERDGGVPVLDSVAVTLWRCLAMVGAAPLAPRWGRLLSGSG